MRWRLAAEARLDLIQIWTHVHRDNPRAADRLIDHFESKFDLIAQTPEMGKREEFAEGVRSLSVREYLIFYELKETRVIVKRVWHGRRDLKDLLSEDEP